MRVAHIVAQYANGLGYEENHLGFFQASLGSEVSIVTSTLSPGTWKDVVGAGHPFVNSEPGLHEDRGVEIRRLKPRLQARRNSQIVLGGLKDSLKAMKPDILHLHGATGALTVQTLAVARALGLPVVIDCHIGLLNLHHVGIVQRAYYEVFRRAVLPYYGSTIRKYVPLSPDAERLLHALLGICISDMAQSTLGADVSAFDFDETAKHEVRRSLGIPDDARVILFSGRLTPEKEVDVLIKAWNAIAEKHDAYLLLVGPAAPDMVGQLAGMVHPRVENRLIMTGFVPNADQPGYMSAADVAVWPGDPGITIIEAMSCHAAIVHTERDAVWHYSMYGNGAAFERGDSHSLTVLLDGILSDPARLTDMRLRSRRLAEEVFDWKVVAARTNRIYQDVLEGTDTSPAIWGSQQ